MKQITITLIALFFSFAISAQKKVTVKEGSHSFSSGSQNALYTTVYGATPDAVAKAWKKKMKNYKSKKVSIKKDEVFADNVLIKDLGDNNTVDVYAKIEKGKDDASIIYVAVNLGGVYLSSSDNADKYKAFSKMLKEFAIDASKAIVLEKVKAAEKELKKMKNKQENLINEKKNLENDIERCKEKIKKAEENIKKNTKAQEEQKKAIEKQIKVVEAIKAQLDQIK